MRALSMAALLFCVSAVPVRAESFTFTGENTVTSRIEFAMPGGGGVQAVNSTGKATATYADGRTDASTSACAVQSRPPEDEFDSTGACEMTDSAGDKFGTTFACNVTSAEKRTVACWGIMVGISGKYQGRSGTVTWTGAGSEDRTTSTASGGGSWQD